MKTAIEIVGDELFIDQKEFKSQVLKNSNINIDDILQINDFIIVLELSSNEMNGDITIKQFQLLEDYLYIIFPHTTTIEISTYNYRITISSEEYISL